MALAAGQCRLARHEPPLAILLNPCISKPPRAHNGLSSDLLDWRSFAANTLRALEKYL